jgi:proteasome accessory factor BC
MARDDEKLLRQLSLVSFLLSRDRPATTNEVRRSVEGYSLMGEQAFARRFYSDREELKQAGISIESVEDESGQTDGLAYYLPEENYYLPDLTLSDAELRSLSVALGLLERTFPFARPLRLALASLTQGRPNPLREELDRTAVSLAPDSEARQLDSALSRLEDAVARRKSVVFGYRSQSSGRQDERRVDPYGLFRIGGHWYVVGRDHDHDDERNFRVSRIMGAVRFATKNPRDFKVPESYDPARHRARPPWLLAEACGEALAEVREDLAWWVERTYPQLVSRPGPEGWRRFSTPYADPNALLAWVFGLGRQARLVEPDALVREATIRLDRIAHLHRTEAPSRDPSSSGRAPAPAETLVRAGGAPSAPASAESRPVGVSPERLSRALALLAYLLEPSRSDKVPLSDVESELGLSRREVEEDLEQLNLMNHGGGTYVIYAEVEGDEILVTRDVLADSHSRPARLSPLMARALLLALDLLGDALPGEGGASLGAVRGKVQQLVGGLDLPAVEVEDLVASDARVMGVLNEALRDRQRVVIEYYTPAREDLSSREVEPYLLFHSGNAWYLEAYCLNAAGQRTFRLDLIRSATPTGRQFSPRSEIDLSSRRSASLAPGDTPSFATIRLPRDRRPILEEQGITVEEAEEGTVRANLPFFSEGWLAREILRYAGEAVLEAPAGPRREVARLAEEIRRMYGGK